MKAEAIFQKREVFKLPLTLDLGLWAGLQKECVPNCTSGFFVCLFSETGFLCPSHPGTHSVDQAGFKLKEICLSLPPWD